MPNDFISKMAKYVAFLNREADIWEHETDCKDATSVFYDKIETCRDICTMFGVRSEVWREAKKIYDWEAKPYE